MTELLVATTNRGKLAEIATFLRPYPLEVIPLESLRGRPEVVEDGATFEENALKKARTLARHSGLVTLADDSGLEVDALGGAPGVHSARYGGANTTDQRNNEKLLAALRDVPEPARGARFVCVLALCAPSTDGIQEWTVRGTCEGRISFDVKGENGFGYDPLFFFPPLGRTFGELTPAVKASVSHRGEALKRLEPILRALLRPEP
ncbi:MAG TPA: XTP/dITP diphosphatase [Candidatus Eisenbacteria bacterium]|nr:XTP/dITP diphosphatase [Candidatus Eisenbacteria bacterium]